jgi:hypothetical protein
MIMVSRLDKRALLKEAPGDCEESVFRLGTMYAEYFRAHLVFIAD